jgi:hypothetical protein
MPLPSLPSPPVPSLSSPLLPLHPSPNDVKRIARRKLSLLLSSPTLALTLALQKYLLHSLRDAVSKEKKETPTDHPLIFQVICIIINSITLPPKQTKHQKDNRKEKKNPNRTELDRRNIYFGTTLFAIFNSRSPPAPARQPPTSIGTA